MPRKSRLVDARPHFTEDPKDFSLAFLRQIVETRPSDRLLDHTIIKGIEKFLKTAQPPADAVVDYGDRAEHCWNGDHTRSNAYSRMRYAQMVLPWAVERMLATAPGGADVKSWRY